MTERDPESIGRTNAERVAFLTRLAGGLAHEIKNPLSTMSINLALLEEDWERAAAARSEDAPEPTARETRSLKRVRTLQREVSRLEAILEEFLNYARVSEVNRQPRDIGEIVTDLLEFVEPENREARILQHVDVEAGLPLVLLDEGPFRQAVMNFLVNARQAMPEGGELVVQVSRAGNHVELRITDTGTGMRPETLERCFDVFWSDKKGGTGLGLSTARRIIEEHGGTIRVVSEEGRGTSFAIYLPLAVELTHSGLEEPRLETEDEA
jgi:signal transduction histidine kinase